MRLAESETNIRVLQQLSASLLTAVDTMQRLRPETNAALARLIPQLEELSLRKAGGSATDDLKRTWFNTWLGLVSSDAGLETVKDLLEGSARVPDVEISADLRWQLLTILSAAGAEGVEEMLALERSSDTSDFGAKSALTAAAARPDPENKTAWLSELRNPETVTGLARQRAVMAGLFPANQTALQLRSLSQILEALPELSKSSDPYFLSSYTSVLLTPMCTPESVARLQSALDDSMNKRADRLNSTALRFLREAHQADRECLALRLVQN
jgi:aminopeptidase N